MSWKIYFSVENLKKNLNLDGSTPKPAIWSCDTSQLFWQLSIDQNMDVQNEVAGSLTSYSSYIGLPVLGTDGWTDRQSEGRTYGHLIWPKFLRWIDNQIFLAMWLGLRTWSFTNSVLQTLISGQISWILMNSLHYVVTLKLDWWNYIYQARRN